MNYEITLNSRVEDIAIMRCDNGWVIRTNHRGGDGFYTPLRVAETPESLTAIVYEWAQSQHKKAQEEPTP